MLAINLIRLAWNLLVFAVSLVIGLIRLLVHALIHVAEMCSKNSDDTTPPSKGGMKCHAR